MATIRGARAFLIVGVLAAAFGGAPVAARAATPTTASARAATRAATPTTAAAAAHLAPAPAAPGPTAPAPPAPAASFRTYTYSLGERGDFVSQYTSVACVGASIQMMLNVIRPGADRTPATQRSLLRLAQQRSNPQWVNRSGGASAMGWAYALGRSGAGRYQVRGYATRSAALAGVVRAIRTTGRPAGLLVWQGVHAWVVTGFLATADPAHGAYALKALVIDDPWWPRATNSHGATVAPGSRLTPNRLAADFVPYRRGHPGFGSALNGAFVVVLPVDATVDPRLGQQPI